MTMAAPAVARKRRRLTVREGFFFMQVDCVSVEYENIRAASQLKNYEIFLLAFGDVQIRPVVK
jgi:hypothetical protein